MSSATFANHQCCSTHGYAAVQIIFLGGCLMYRPLMFSAAMIAATGTYSWSQNGVDVPATTGPAPATSNADVNLGIPNTNSPNVPGTSLPKATNAQAEVATPAAQAQGSATTGPNNAAPRTNLGVDSNQNNRRDALDRREERREDRRDGTIGDDNRRLGVDDRGARNPNDNQWRYKYHNNHWWYYQPDNSWVIYHSNNWVPYNSSTYSNYYPSTTNYSGGYRAGLCAGLQPTRPASLQFVLSRQSRLRLQQWLQ